MSAQKSMKCQVRALMISLFVALGVSVINSTAKAEDDASRFSYVRLHCTPDNQSHFTDVTAELAKENSAPPAAPIAIGGNKPTSKAFIAGFGAHWGAADLPNHLDHLPPQFSYSPCFEGNSRLPRQMARRDSYMPVTWSYWKTSHLAEGILPSSATNPDFDCLLANQAIASRIRSASGTPHLGLGAEIGRLALDERDFAVAETGAYCHKSRKSRCFQNPETPPRDGTQWLGRQDFEPGNGGIKIRGMTLIGLHISPDCRETRPFRINTLPADSRPTAPLAAFGENCSQRLIAGLTCVERGLQASHETGHDDDGQDLHRPRDADDKKEIVHHPVNLGKVGIRPT